MLGKISFLQLQDEDEVSSSIIQNRYEVEEASSSTSVKTLLPTLIATTLLVDDLPIATPPMNEHPIAILLAATSTFHTMLPYELKVPCVNKATMIGLNILVQGRFFNINKLSEEQHLQLEDLLKSHQHASA